MAHPLESRDSRSGFPALAYTRCDDSSPVSSYLIFKLSESRAQATLLLQSSLFIDGFDVEQTFILQYDADDLVPGKISLGPAAIPLPQKRLDEIAREGNPKMSTLTLTLKKSEHEDSLHRLANLAKATELQILFDYNWLHCDHHVIFQRLVDCPDQLSGFPTWRYYRKEGYRRVDDWSAFESGDGEHADRNAATEDEAVDPPPVYGEGSKRPRHVSTSPPSSPSAKRVLLSPYGGCMHTSSTSIATPSPEPPPPPARLSLDLDLPPVLTPVPRHCIAACSECPLSPIALQAQSPKSLFLAASSQRPSVSCTAPLSKPDLEEAVASQLPDVLDRLLPSLLPRLLTAASPAPSSQQSIASQISHAPPPPKLSALGMSLHDRLASTVESELESIYAHTLSHASWLRTSADDKFTDQLEEERLALDRVAESKFEELKQQCEDLEEDVLERVGQKAEDLCDGVTEQMTKDILGLEKKKKTLMTDIEELRKDKEELRTDKEELRRHIMELRMDRDKLRASKG